MVIKMKEKRSKEEKKNLINRLNRIEGQIRGISTMVEEDRHYADLSMQILSVINALRSISKSLIRSHIDSNCPNLNQKQVDELDMAIEWLDKFK